MNRRELLLATAALPVLPLVQYLPKEENWFLTEIIDWLEEIPTSKLCNVVAAWNPYKMPIDCIKCYDSYNHLLKNRVSLIVRDPISPLSFNEFEQMWKKDIISYISKRMNED